MAHGIGAGRPIRVHQALHGYSDGHRLLASSASIPGRDAKTMLMMSDASGPGASIDEYGYLTGYPLPESGFFAIARTWDAPEMPRPGCVWTHTLLVDFSDLPSLASANVLLPLFHRPSGTFDAYEAFLNPKPTDTSDSTSFDEAWARQLLWGLYANPKQPLITSRIAPSEKETLALAIWDQQWPRLKRSFRFCTLSFADRSTAGALFDLQILPAQDRVSRAQFQNALDLDRTSASSDAWLEDAIKDLHEGASGPLREFLKESGGDTGGRESFVPLTTVYSLSREFVRRPQSIEDAVEVLERAFPSSQARATRALIARIAGSSPETLGVDGLDFVIRNWELLHEEDARECAPKVGAALWAKNPHALGALLSDAGTRRSIADAALAHLGPHELIQGLARAPELISTLLPLRPDLPTSPSFWSLREAWAPRTLETVFRLADAAGPIVSSMIGAENAPIRQVCRLAGSELVLRSVIEHLDSVSEGASNQSAKSWLDEASSDANTLAKVLSEGFIQRASTLDAMSHVMTPDFVPNQFGEDPWIIACRSAHSESEFRMPVYLSCFLLTRALGYRSRSSAALIRLTFDTVYSAAEQSQLPDAAWRLLERRLPDSYTWNSWDRCKRLRSGVVDAFVDRWLPAEDFVNVTADRRIFLNLLNVAADSRSGRSYLQHVTANGTAGRSDRLALIEEKLEW